jgi:hypothetical protein
MPRSLVILASSVAASVLLLAPSGASAESPYLVKATGGPVPASPEEAAEFLENVVIPNLDWLAKHEKVTGGLPVGARASIFIVWAESNAEVDEMLRGMPLWPFLEWKVVPLQSFEARVDLERKIVARTKQTD